MVSKVMLVLVIALGAVGARAQIGETMEECDKRYGSPTVYSEVNDEGQVVRTYTNGTFSIDVMFFKRPGTKVFEAHGIVCKKTEETAGGKITKDEIKDFLKTNSSAGQTWASEASGVPAVDQWLRSDRKVIALYGYKDDKWMLEIMTPRMMERVKQLQQGKK